MAHLTAEERRHISKSDTGLPGKRTKAGGAVSGSYPMPDKAHARAAKSLVAQHGTPAEKKTVNAKADKILGTKKGTKSA